MSPIPGSAKAKQMPKIARTPPSPDYEGCVLAPLRKYRIHRGGIGGGCFTFLVDFNVAL